MDLCISPTFHFNPLCDVSTRAALKTLSCIIQSCFGPHGELKLLQHCEGGSTTLTSSSQRLLNQISSQNIFIKVILSTVKCQLNLMKDGGLCCALLILKLVSYLDSYPLPLVGTLYTHFSKLYMECLSEETNSSVLSTNFDNLHHLKCIAITLLSSKPGCVLTPGDKNHLSTLLLKAFLGVLPSYGFNIRFITIDGISAKQSRLCKGILLPVSKLDLIDYCDMTTGKVVLFSASLSEDLEFPNQNMENSHSDTLREMTIQIVEKLISKLISEKIAFVFCQKVIHPKFKLQLKTAGVMVLDRLGSQAFKYVHYISGGVTTNSFVSSELFYGAISSSGCEQFGSKTFLRLCNDHFPSFTLLLGNYNEQASAELKMVCEQTVDCLFRILKNPKVCFGGGCTELHTAHLLAQKMREDKNFGAIHHETGCNSNQIQIVFESFLRCILDICVAIQQGNHKDFVTEKVRGHLWRVQDERFSSAEDTCQCGRYLAQDINDCDWIPLSYIGHENFSPLSIVDSRITDSMVLLDELSCKKNSLSLAFQTSILLLRTSVCINNSNYRI